MSCYLIYKFFFFSFWWIQVYQYLSSANTKTNSVQSDETFKRMALQYWLKK